MATQWAPQVSWHIQGIMPRSSADAAALGFRSPSQPSMSSSSFWNVELCGDVVLGHWSALMCEESPPIFLIFQERMTTCDYEYAWTMIPDGPNTSYYKGHSNGPRCCQTFAARSSIPTFTIRYTTRYDICCKRDCAWLMYRLCTLGSSTQRPQKYNSRKTNFHRPSHSVHAIMRIRTIRGIEEPQCHSPQVSFPSFKNYWQACNANRRSSGISFSWIFLSCSLQLSQNTLLPKSCLDFSACSTWSMCLNFFAPFAPLVRSGKLPWSQSGLEKREDIFKEDIVCFFLRWGFLEGFLQVWQLLVEMEKQTRRNMGRWW